MKFARVETIEDLDSLNEADIFEGYLSAERGDRHGWCNRQRDYGALPNDGIAISLASQWLEVQRAARK